MDILNFISWIKGKRIVTTVDPAKTLLPLGLKDDRRDDGYLAGAITVEDFIAEVISEIPVPPVVVPLYKTIQLKVSQSSTNAPVVTVLNNDFPGVTFNSNYISNGSYYLEFNTSIFDAADTFWLVSPAVASHIGCDLTGGDIFEITTRLFDGTLTNGILNNTLIEIRVYN